MNSEDDQSSGDEGERLSDDAFQGDDEIKLDIEASDAIRLREHSGVELLPKSPAGHGKSGEIVRRGNASLSRCPGPSCEAIYSTSQPLDGSPLCRVICELCGAKFCFSCGGNYHAPATCEVMKEWLRPRLDEEARDQRFLSYFKRWLEQSLALAKETDMRRSVNRRIDEMLWQGGNGTWIDYQPVRQAMNGLFRARYTLQYSIPHAYMLPNEVKELYEFSQAELEDAVEELSNMLSNLPSFDRSDIANKAAVIEKRRVIMFQDFGNGTAAGAS